MFKEYALKHFDSGRALRSPAHITLEPPFKWDKEQLYQLELKLSEFASSQEKFSIQINGFDVFAPRVIFLDIMKNDKLNEIQSNLAVFLRNEFNLISDRPYRSYHPHMTIAFKDLQKSRFHEAWDYFSLINYQRIFEVDRIFLLEHNGKNWEVRTTFKFKKAQN